MNTILFTIISIFALFTSTLALPAAIPSEPLPRSLLGRYYLRQGVSHANIRAILPVEDGEFVGRADRFMALQHRRTAREANSLLSNHTRAQPAHDAAVPEDSAAHATPGSTQVQTLLGSTPPPVSHTSTIVGRPRSGRWHAHIGKAKKTTSAL